MKLIASAKPIRIRIMSGGEEHFSLDSLRHNFCVQDIFPLIIDKRLSRWLRQQNKEELAASVDDLGENVHVLDAITYVEVLNLFFPEEKEKSSAKDIYSLYDYWHDYKPEIKNVFSYLRQYLLDTHDGKQYMIQHYCSDLSKEELYDSLQEIDEKEDDAQLSYLRGKMYYDGFEKDGKIVRDIVKASELIKNAAEQNHIEAKAFIASHDFSLARKLSLLTPEAKDAINVQINRWKDDAFGYTNNIRSTDSEIVKEVKKLLKEFSIFRKANFLIDNFYYVRNTYQKLDKNDIFYRERRFLLELVRDYYNADSMFVELANKYHYPLAEYMLDYKNNHSTKIDGVNFGQMSFADKLEFIVDHLFEY